MTPREIASVHSAMLFCLANAAAQERQIGPGRTVRLPLAPEVVELWAQALREGIRIIDREAPVLEPAPGGD